MSSILISSDYCFCSRRVFHTFFSPEPAHNVTCHNFGNRTPYTLHLHRPFSPNANQNASISYRLTLLLMLLWKTKPGRHLLQYPSHLKNGTITIIILVGPTPQVELTTLSIFFHKTTLTIMSASTTYTITYVSSRCCQRRLRRRNPQRGRRTIVFAAAVWSFESLCSFVREVSGTTVGVALEECTS